MGRQIAIVIAVEKAEGLPALPGALAGAREFASWAAAEGFDIVQLSDEGGEPVLADHVYRAIEGVVRGNADSRDVDRLVIFFSGHGISKGAFADHWLLSRAPENPNEAVNVVKSIRLARRCGIPHVVIIADACRTNAQKDHAGIEGFLIFPSLDIADVELDQFFAARSGDPAYEKVSDDERRAAYGLFTKCLVSGLTEDRVLAAEPVIDGIKPLAVTAKSLRDYLRESVPKAASRAGVKQQPDCVAGSYWPPNVIEWVDEPKRRFARRRPRPPKDRDRGMWTKGELQGGLRALDKDLIEAANELIPLEAPGLFETRSGLTIMGAQVREVATSRGHEGFFHENGLWHVRGTGEAASVVIDLGDDRYAAVAMLPDFIGTVHVGLTGVDLVTYRGAAFGPYGDEDERTVSVLSLIGAASRLGLHDLAIDEAMEFAELFRQYKHQNPTFGIYAAYAYERAGRLDQVTSMIDFFRQARQIIPYDLSLLASEPTTFDMVAPMFPMMTQGWAYLDSDSIHPAVSAASSTLLPSLWATPSGEGGRALFNAVERDELE